MPDAQPREAAATLERLLNGRVEASERYVEYDGQVIVRTRGSTLQRWKSSGWDPGPRGDLPYLLSSTYCRGTIDDPMNSHLAIDEVEVYYVEDGETVRYRVETTDSDNEATDE